ncbi:Lead, cadmium, zinc and mercury transporting ATPase [Labilithrix luteola]|uniref:P-type Zn(2+) transporter n=1 Tax=Labilithrix luteola TaxID=1391654 RepID=A0A0K1Q2I2_9BACT|nr:heavy metal translocating P-type ATPase [Labilithrix luteola]AKU99594.1 Lead, cadmium, zinc and mercury transporting ATPase [Labilithrix luteola]
MDIDRLLRRSASAQPVIALAGLAAGAVFALLGWNAARDAVWAAVTTAVLAFTVISAARDAMRGKTGVDLIAILAMAGALALQEFLAGALLALMLTGGSALETYAARRARRELTALLERAPRIAHRLHDDTVVDIAVDAIATGDVLLVKQGEVTPTDGILVSGIAALDESAITGESRTVTIHTGDKLSSGSKNAGAPFEFRATTRADESTYAGIVRLVREAETSKGAFVRSADRYASRFLVLTLVVAGVAWLVSGQAVRALSVLVVATPCPLLLAAPAAILAGVSYAARYGIILKGGGPLETLGLAKIVLLDKTGTITRGRPRVVAVETFGELDGDELVRLAAAVEQVATHPFAPSILAEARNRGLDTPFPTDAREEAGAGISGVIEGRRVAVGRAGFVAPGAARSARVRAIETRTAAEGSSSAFVSVDGELAGALLLEDPIRAEAPRALHALRKTGIARIVMVTGDHPDVAELVGDAVGVDKVLAERSPEEKVEAVRTTRGAGKTIMVGDGVNDAPALALADVGVAMGARGASAASEAADVVLTADRLEGLVWAVRIAQRTRYIALQSILAGMGMSLVAMVVAALGFLPPAAGAVLQEGIDLAVILNALRALGGGRIVPPRLPGQEELAAELHTVHTHLRPRVEELATLPARLDVLSPDEARNELERMRDFLENELLVHERDEQRTAYPMMARLFHGEDVTGPLVRTHQEIARLVRLFSRLVDQLPPQGPHPGDLRDLRRVLYGLHAILALHFSQEDELYSILDMPSAGSRQSGPSASGPSKPALRPA